MALNVGQDFKKRWLDAPVAVRQSFLDDLNRICALFEPQTQVEKWLENDQRAVQVAQLQVEQAYADLKAQLIEEARLRKQLALEQSLADKRAQQEDYNQQLLDDEKKQFAIQTLSLNALRQEVDYNIAAYAAKYQKNPEHNLDFSQRHFNMSDDQIKSELESVRLRLELEAETFIEQAVQDFRQKLKAASQEEIAYILENSTFSDEK